MKKACSMFCLCFVLFLFSGCTYTKQNTSNEVSTAESKEVASLRAVKKVTLDKDTLLPGIKKIVERGTLRVAMIDVDMDGFCEKRDDGSLTGIYGQLTQDIANSLGVSLEINKESNTYNKLTELLIQDKVDLVIARYSLTATRAASVKLSKPYLTSRFGVMVNKQELVRNQIEKNPIDYMQSNNMKIAALKGTSHVDLVKEIFPNAQVVEMNDYKEMYTAVKKGEVFGYLCGELRFLYDYTEDKELSLYTKVFAFSDVLENYCIGVSPDNNDLLNFVNAYIDSSKKIVVKDYERYLKEKSDKK